MPRLHTMRAFLFLSSSALICSVTASSASPSDSSWVLFPDKPLVKPLLSNPQEPRVGLRKEIGASRMRLDIGAAIEFLGFSPGRNDHFRLGASMFIYALTTSRQGLRLQVDAADGFFGGYVVYQTRPLRVRLRALHHSAHFVDGHIDPATRSWIGGVEPVPYTRDFGELLVFVEESYVRNVFTLYSGVSYATLVRPSEVRRVATLHGIEWHNDVIVGTLLGTSSHVYCAYNLVISGVPHYVGTHSIEGGIKLGEWVNNGLRFFLSYQNGLEVYGQYFRVRQESWNLGFAFDVL